MPVVPNHQPPLAGTPERPSSSTILVVDDDADVGETTATNLRRGGLRARTALNGGYPRGGRKTQPFDVVVRDHHPTDKYSENLLEEAPDMGLAVTVSAAPPSVLTDITKRQAETVFVVKRSPVVPSELVEVVRAAVTVSRNQRNQ